MNSGMLLPPRKVTITGASVEIVAFNPRRAYLLVQNQGEAIAEISTEQAGIAGLAIQIDKGGFWEPHFVPVNPIYARSTGADLDLVIIEGVY